MGSLLYRGGFLKGLAHLGRLVVSECVRSLGGVCAEQGPPGAMPWSGGEAVGTMSPRSGIYHHLGGKSPPILPVHELGCLWSKIPLCECPRVLSANAGFQLSLPRPSITRTPRHRHVRGSRSKIPPEKLPSPVFVGPAIQPPCQALSAASSVCSTTQGCGRSLAHGKPLLI